MPKESIDETACLTLPSKSALKTRKAPNSQSSEGDQEWATLPLLAGEATPKNYELWPWEIEGIAAGTTDLVLAIDENREVASPAKEAHHVVEIIHGFLKSQQDGNTKIHLPLTRP